MKIKLKITLFICMLMSILTLIGIATGYFQGFKLLRDTMIEEHQEITKQQALIVSKLIDEELKDIVNYANSTLWGEIINEINGRYELTSEEDIQSFFMDADKKWPAFSEEDYLLNGYLDKRLTKRLKKIVEDDKNIAEIFITDKRGGLIAASGKTTDFYQGDEQWWQRAFNNPTEGLFLENIGFNKSTGIFTMTTVLPLKNEEDKIIGICKTRINLKYLLQELESFEVRKGGHGHAVLIDEHLNILYHKKIIPYTTKLTREDISSQINEKQGFITDKLNIHQGKMLVTCAKVKNPFLLKHGITWKVCVVQEAQEIFTPLRKLILQLSIIIAVLLGVLTPTGLFLGSLLVVKPLSKLHRAIEYISKGNIDYPIDVKSGDEIEDLADSFKEMISTIKEKQRELLSGKTYTESIIASLIDSLIVIDSKGRIKNVNKSALDLLNYQEGELIGQPIETLFAEKEILRETFNKLLEEKKSLNFDADYLTKNTEKIPVSFCGSIIYEDKTASGAVIVCRDMRPIKTLINDLKKSKQELEELSLTLEKRVEERTNDLIRSQEEMLNILKELRESKDTIERGRINFLNIVENNINGIIILDQAGLVRYINPAAEKILGRKEEEIVGSLFNYISSPNDKKEIEIVNNTGKTLLIELAAAKTEWENKSATLVSIRDMSYLKSVEELERLKRVYIQTVNALIMSAEKRDPYTGGHQRKVARLAISIAQEMKCSNNFVECVGLAGILHDIGKIYVPDKILTKPDKLDREEWDIIKNHPQFGYDILKHIDFPWPIAQIILQHHERLDGSGYPHGLSGGQILLEAKIIAVADVVEAMSCERPYRPALSIDFVLEEISRNKGSLFDAKVVDACCRLFREKRFVFNE
ncbi:MAG: HD domain-containing phosphohydrolase [Candidatus Omnitrophota bacterium]